MGCDESQSFFQQFTERVNRPPCAAREICLTLFIWPMAGRLPAYYFCNNDVHDYDTTKVVYHVRDRKLLTIDEEKVVYWIRDAKVYDNEECSGPPIYYLGD